MRSYRGQIQELWFCDFEEQLVGVNTVKVYGKPEKKRFSVSATAGYVHSWGAGLSLSYDRYITCFDRDFHVAEGTMVFVDVVPELDKDGNLIAVFEYQKDENGEYVLDEDGEKILTKLTYETEPDYMIKNIFDTQKGKVARYGIKKV